MTKILHARRIKQKNRNTGCKGQSNLLAANLTFDTELHSKRTRGNVLFLIQNHC
jgi:hypothetical protein